MVSHFPTYIFFILSVCTYVVKTDQSRNFTEHVTVTARNTCDCKLDSACQCLESTESRSKCLPSLCPKKLSTRAVVGIAIGVLSLVLGLPLAIGFCLVYRRRNNLPQTDRENPTERRFYRVPFNGGFLQEVPQFRAHNQEQNSGQPQQHLQAYVLHNDNDTPPSYFEATTGYTS